MRFQLCKNHHAFLPQLSPEAKLVPCIETDAICAGKLFHTTNSVLLTFSLKHTQEYMLHTSRCDISMESLPSFNKPTQTEVVNIEYYKTIITTYVNRACIL